MLTWCSLIHLKEMQAARKTIKLTEKDLTVLSYELVAEVDQLPDPYVRQVRLDRVRQSTGRDKWAIRKGGQVYTTRDEWEYEPMPSSRTDAFLARARFDCVEDALDAWDRREK